MAFIRITLRIKNKNFELQKSAFRASSQNLISGIFGGIVANIRFEQDAELAFDFWVLGVFLGINLRRGRKFSTPMRFRPAKGRRYKIPIAEHFSKPDWWTFFTVIFVQK